MSHPKEKDRGRKVYPAEEAYHEENDTKQGPNQGVLRPDIMRAPEVLKAQEPPRQPRRRQQRMENELGREEDTMV